MKNYHAVTISDASRSKHFIVTTAMKSSLIIAGVAVLVVFFMLLVTNTFQVHAIETLAFEKETLHRQLSQADHLIADFRQKVSQNQQQTTNLSQELVAIEKFSGVDTGDAEYPLAERIARIGNFYTAREEEYSEIGSRVEKIESVIGVGIGIGDDLAEQNSTKRDSNLLSRVNLASLTVSQERMLHDNIPNGYPLKERVVTSHFGMRKHPVTKVKSFHNGVDLRAKTNTKIFSTADGFVSNANYSELSGNRIVILHNFGFETHYSHLKKMLVSPGDVINKGDLIGHSGNTGRSVAPHLHYEIRHIRRPINPFQFLEWEFGRHEIFTQVRGIKWPYLINLINKQITHQTLQLSQLDRISPVK